MIYPKTELREAFEKLFQKTSGCWEWQGSKDDKGYGYFYHNALGKTERAHRKRIYMQTCLKKVGAFV